MLPLSASAASSGVSSMWRRRQVKLVKGRAAALSTAGLKSIFTSARAAVCKRCRRALRRRRGSLANVADAPSWQLLNGR